MDDTTANGQEPMELAKVLFESIVREQKEVLVAPITSRAAIAIRHFCPSIYFWIMKKRAKKIPLQD